MKSALSE